MSAPLRVASICDKGTNVMEVTMSQLVEEVSELCQLRPPSDFNSSRHQLNSFELFFLVIGSLVVGMLIGVVGVACFKRQVMTMTMAMTMMMMKMANMLEAYKGGVLQTSELTKETADAQIAQFAQIAQLAHSQETETFAISKKNVSVGILLFCVEKEEDEIHKQWNKINQMNYVPVSSERARGVGRTRGSTEARRGK